MPAWLLHQYFVLLVGVWTNWPGKIPFLFHIRYYHFTYKSIPEYTRLIDQKIQWHECDLMLNNFSEFLDKVLGRFPRCPPHL